MSMRSSTRCQMRPTSRNPALRRAPLGLGPWRRFSARRVELDALLSEHISQRRNNGVDGYDDVLSVLMSDHDGAKRSDEDVRQQLRTLLVSGHETSATTLAWALFHVHADEKVRQKLLDELADNPGAEQLPKLGVAAMWVYHPLISRRLARITALAGVELIAWTVDDLSRMRKLAAAGVNGLVSNDPRLFGELGSRIGD